MRLIGIEPKLVVTEEEHVVRRCLLGLLLLLCVSKEAEAKVEQYRSKTNLFLGNNNTTLSNQQLGDFNGQLASARAQKVDAEAKAKLIRDALKAGSAIEFADITNSELMRRLTDLGIQDKDLSTHQSSLEDIFVELVHGGKEPA